jgi:hypothetical protein
MTMLRKHTKVAHGLGIQLKKLISGRQTYHQGDNKYAVQLGIKKPLSIKSKGFHISVLKEGVEPSALSKPNVENNVH